MVFRTSQNPWSTRPRCVACRNYRSWSSTPKRQNIPFTITREIVRQKLVDCKNRCEVTGGPFDYSFRNDVYQNTFAPSLDQRIPRAGYTPENTQIVALWYNRMKGDLADEEAKTILKSAFCEQQFKANA